MEIPRNRGRDRSEHQTLTRSARIFSSASIFLIRRTLLSILVMPASRTTKRSARSYPYPRSFPSAPRNHVNVCCFLSHGIHLDSFWAIGLTEELTFLVFIPGMFSSMQGLIILLSQTTFSAEKHTIDAFGPKSTNRRMAAPGCLSEWRGCIRFLLGA